MSAPLLRSRAVVLVSLVGLQPLSAQEHRPVGDSTDALTGIRRVPLVSEAKPRLAAAFDAGYALTESQRGEGSHHRFGGSVAMGWVPLSGLGFAIRSALRHDRHPSDAIGSDTGTLGDATLIARWGTRLGAVWRVGVDTRCYFPGSEKATESLSHPALDGRLLWDWLPSAGLHIAGFAGFRWDHTAGVGTYAPRYQVGDRLALALSDFNAVLLGIGTTIPVSKVELLAETTYDLLIGRGAPSPVYSPIRLDVGVRTAISRTLQAELMTELALSARPEVQPTSALIPIEPRVGIGIGLRYRLWDAPTPQRATTSASPTPLPASQAPKRSPAPVVAVQPPKGRVIVTVVDPAGHPLSDAVVELSSAVGTRRLDFQGGSTFDLSDVAKGSARLTVRADLMREWSREVEISEDEPLQLKVSMVMGDNAGQIRGIVRGFDGKPLPARVTIEPGDRAAQVGDDGAFSVEVGPGKYRVRISLDGFEPQLREVTVGRNGVIVLNVDLKKGR